jgi:hypothetical protein
MQRTEKLHYRPAEVKGFLLAAGVFEEDAERLSCILQAYTFHILSEIASSLRLISKGRPKN